MPPALLLVIHRVAAHAVGLGGFDHDVARQVGDLAAVRAGAEVFLGERLVQGQGCPLDLDNRSLFRARGLRAAQGAVVAARGFRAGDDDPIARLPAADRFRQCHLGIACIRGRAQFDPGAAQRRAVHVPAAAADQDGGQRLLVRPLEIRQPDGGRHVRGHGVIGRADLQRRHRHLRVHRAVVAHEAVLARLLAGLDLDQADVESGVAIAGERQRAGDVQHAQRLIGVDVVGHRDVRGGFARNRPPWGCAVLPRSPLRTSGPTGSCTP